MSKDADLILKNGWVFTGYDIIPIKASVAIKDGKILKVGNVENVSGENTKIYDCEGKLISPGFNDAHTHIPYGAFLLDSGFGLDFKGESDKEVFLPKLKEFADKHPKNEWIYGYNGGWGPDTIPDRHDIDKWIPDRPVVFQHMDGHSTVVNTRSLEKRGLNKDMSVPPGGKVSYGDDGELDGRMYDDATFLFSKIIYNPSDEEFKRIYRNFMKYAAMLGITAAGELYPTFVGKEDVYSIFKELEDEDELTLRISFAVKLLDYDTEAYQKICREYCSNKLRCYGTKDLLDGVISVHTALMLEPYSDDPTTCGCTANPPDKIKESVLKAAADGVPVRLHCIGDGAVRMALDFIEESQRIYGYKGQRHGIEHIELCSPDDFKRFNELNVCANMQPMHAVFDPKAEEHFRGERCKWCWPMRDLLDCGAMMSMGTDFPIVELNPLYSLYAAVTRKDPYGKLKEGWQKHQAIILLL